MGIPNSINNLVIFRQFIDPRTTIGQIYLNGEFIAYTLEDTLRPDRIKLKKETAIEEGMYKSRLYTSQKFGLCVAIDDVPNFTHIRIHGGSNHTHSWGCVLIGLSRDKTNFKIGRSSEAMEKLLGKLQNGKKIYTTIINQIGLDS